MSATADESLAPTEIPAQRRLTPTEQLMYSTLRLSYEENGKTRWGTGFTFRLFNTGNAGLPVIVTNRHVVIGMKHCSFSFSALGSDGLPDPDNHIPVYISNFDKMWIAHPSTDLAIIPLGNIFDQLISSSKRPFFAFLGPSLIPTDDEFNDLTPVEQVLTVGYPGQLWDSVHNLPVFHRGYTATAPYIAFNGKQEFLIDFSTWPGASGSPVLLYNDNGWMDRKGNTVLGGIRIKLLGVVYGVAIQDVSGNVVIQNGPTSVALPGQIAIPTNLGACIKASEILAFEPLLVNQYGTKPPQGYKMRAQ